MSISCSVIRDLLPLYAEDLAGEESKALVEKHLEACADCKAALEDLKEPKPVAVVEEAVPLRLMKQLMRKHTLFLIILAVCLTATLALIVLSRMTAPEAVGEEALAFFENNNGRFSFRITGNAPQGTTLQMEYFTDESGRNCVAVSPYTSPWLRLFGKNTDGTIIATSRGDLDLAYYCNQRKGGTLQLLYPMHDQPNLGAALPRLVLNDYLIISLVLAILFLLLALLFRKKASGRTLLHTALAFNCYAPAHLAVKGTNGITYFLQQDLVFILLTALTLFGAVFSALSLYRLQK